MKLHISNFKPIMILCLLSISLFGQTIEKPNPPEFIKGISLKPLTVNVYAPIVALGEPILLSFDDLQANGKTYTYSVIHCDYNWKPSQLSSTEYIDGLTSDYINDYSNSFNTYQSYTHYQVSIPNDRMRLKISGNYILQIKNDLDELIFTRRFMVYQPLVNVGVSVHKSQIIADFDTHQNVQFTINTGALHINNPRDEIKIKLFQNMDWNTEIDNIKPQYYSGNQLIYKYADKTQFEGGNEFLYFDTKTIRTATNHVARSILDKIYNTYLYTDEDRHNKPYTLYPDIDGNFVIRVLNNNTAITEADYSKVHFSLNVPFDADKTIYVYGDFNNWQLTDNNRLTYNKQDGLYGGTLLLKQGFYNYKYVVKDANGLKVNAISGNFYQTENAYTVLVYLSEFGSRYDKLIGVGHANSKNLQN